MAALINERLREFLKLKCLQRETADANCKLQFAVSHEKANAKGLYLRLI